MCLYRAIKIDPVEDIICYKVVDFESGKYMSPYFNKQWKLNRLESLKARTKPDAWHWVSRTSEEIDIEGGAYHTYAHIEDAEYLARMRGHKSAILECRIPKSSKYIYMGYPSTVHRTDGTGYASQKLKPIREVAVIYPNAQF